MLARNLIPPPKPATGALALETYELTKRFGSFTALDRVSLRVAPGTVHALLGENGAGKSTLVKCVAGFQRPDGGSLVIDGRETDIANPVVARQLGIGMVYQHFTLAPGMTVAENLLLAGERVPTVVDWTAQRVALHKFLATTPFRLDLDARAGSLAAGEKQKLELLKQLYLRPRLLILDEPTSVLTPQEADEVLGHVREFAHQGHCSVILITHKFREVMAYADDVTVLRRGVGVHHVAVKATDPQQLAQAMMGGAEQADVGQEAMRVIEAAEMAETAEASDGVVPVPCGARCAGPERTGRPGHAGPAWREPAGACRRDPGRGWRVGQWPARTGRGARGPAPAPGRCGERRRPGLSRAPP